MPPEDADSAPSPFVGDDGDLPAVGPASGALAGRLREDGVRDALVLCRTALSSPRPFIEWLRARPRRRVVGRAGVGEASPLANFLSEMAGHRVHVGRSEALLCGSLQEDSPAARYAARARVILPAWARRVERGLGEVTAGRALEVVIEVRDGHHGD